MAAIDFLGTELTARITHFEDESRAHKTLYRTFRYWSLGLSAGASVLAGAALVLPGQAGWIGLLVLAATSGAGVVTALEGLRKPAELWIHERATLNRLRDLKRELDWHAARGEGEAQAEALFERLQQVLAGSAEQWHQQVAQLAPPPAPPVSAPARDDG